MKISDFINKKKIDSQGDIIESFMCSWFGDMVGVGITNDINRLIKFQLSENKVKEENWNFYLVDKDADACVLDFDEDSFKNHAIILKYDCELNVLIHELIHLGFNIFTRRKIDHNIHTDEVWAYFYDYLFREIINCLK